MNTSDPIPVDAASVATYKARFWRQNPRILIRHLDQPTQPAFMDDRPREYTGLRAKLFEANKQKWQATR